MCASSFMASQTLADFVVGYRNKIGHALHELDPTFRAFTLENPDIKNLVRELDVHRIPQVIQSMVRPLCTPPSAVKLTSEPGHL